MIDVHRVRVVLVRARNPNNIGAVARAMHDFGFRRLVLVTEYEVPFLSARSAVDANEVLAGAQVFATVAEAVAGCTLAVGTTAVGERDVQHPLLGLGDAGPRLAAELAGPEGEVALLFGSEKTGLSNEEMSHCDLLVTIPMAMHEGVRHPSMNLGQAVAVCLWELVRPGVLPAQAAPVAAPAEDLERLHGLLSEMLTVSGYTRHHPANSDAASVRRLVHRMALRRVDVPVWLGMLRQIIWKLRHPAE